MKRRLSPQEKKAHSYAKDRRNTYGENDKSSRKNIPLAKARGHRAARRQDKILLAHSPLSDDVVQVRRKPEWKKSPDNALGQYLDWRLGRFSNNPDSADVSERSAVRVRVKKLFTKKRRAN